MQDNFSLSNPCKIKKLEAFFPGGGRIERERSPAID